MCRMCRDEIQRFSHSNLADMQELARWHILECGRLPSVRWMRRQVSHAVFLAVQDEIIRYQAEGASPIVSYCLRFPKIFDHRKGLKVGRLLNLPKGLLSFPRQSGALKGATYASLLGGLIYLLTSKDGLIRDLEEAGLLANANR